MPVKALKSAFLTAVFALGFFGARSQDANLVRANKTANVDSAIYYAERYIDYAKTIRDTAQIIDGVCLLARKYTIKSLYTKAGKVVEECLAFSFVSKNKIFQGKLFLELANVYKYEGSYAKALEFYLEAEKEFESAQAWSGLVQCKIELAEYYRKLAKFKLANENIDSGLNLYNKNNLSDTNLLIHIYNRSAAIENESNIDPLVSIRNSRIALNLAKKSHNLDAEATSLNELGFSYKNLHKIDSAEIYYKTAEQIWFSLGADREAINAMNNRGMLYLHSGYSEQTAIRIYHDIIKMVNEKKIDYPLEDAYRYLWIEYSEAGDTVAAFNYLYFYHQNVVANMAKKNDLAVTNIIEKYENKKAKKNLLQVSDKLVSSQAENRIKIFFISLLLIMLLVIALLLLQIKKTNKTLLKGNKEKDTLIQEIHHRVKNNLQFIGSLINMQINSSVDSKEVHSLNDASRRIRAMALVHEMLYNQKESSGILIRQYLEELVLSLNELVNSDKIPVVFKLDITNANFNVSDSIALGMITSELVSNSMKYAFSNVKDPSIEIQLHQTEKKEYKFIVKDNGIGPKESGSERKTLGKRLIDIFSRQLKGKYFAGNDNGYRYELLFKVK